MKCTQLLVQEHKLMWRALDVLSEMAKEVEDHQPVEHDDVEAILRFLRTFGDDYHQSKEESALFPELKKSVVFQQGPLSQMLFEHDQERSLVEGLEDALYTKNTKNFVHFANRLVDLLRNHIHKEDNILFEAADRVLSAPQDEHVVAEFEKFTLDPVLLDDFRKLEWKYMRRVARKVA